MNRIERLGRALDAVEPALSEEGAVELAVHGQPRRRRTPRWVPIGAGAIGAGALAVLTLFAIRPGRDAPRDSGPMPAIVGTPGPEASAPPGAAREEPEFSIEAPSEGHVVVFQTRNPKIRVVWFYDDAGPDE